MSINCLLHCQLFYVYINDYFLFVELPSDWSQALQRLGLPSNLDFYQLYCQPLIRDRIKDIITTSWERTVEKTHAEITRLIDCPEIIWSCKYNTMDIGSYVSYNSIICFRERSRRDLILDGRFSGHTNQPEASSKQ